MKKEKKGGEGDRVQYSILYLTYSSLVLVARGYVQPRLAKHLDFKLPKQGENMSRYTCRLSESTGR